MLLSWLGELAGKLLAGDGDPDQHVPWLGAGCLAVPGAQLGEVEVAADSLKEAEAADLY